MKELFYAVAVKVKAAFRASDVSVTAGREVRDAFFIEAVRAIKAAFYIAYKVVFVMVQTIFPCIKRKLAYSFCLFFLLLFFPCFLFSAEAVFTGESFRLHETRLFGMLLLDKDTDGNPGGKSGEETNNGLGHELTEKKNEVHVVERIFGFLFGLFFGMAMIGIPMRLAHTIHREKKNFNESGGENVRK